MTCVAYITFTGRVWHPASSEHLKFWVRDLEVRRVEPFQIRMVEPFICGEWSEAAAKGR